MGQLNQEAFATEFVVNDSMLSYLMRELKHEAFAAEFVVNYA